MTITQALKFYHVSKSKMDRALNGEEIKRVSDYGQIDLEMDQPIDSKECEEAHSIVTRYLLDSGKVRCIENNPCYADDGKYDMIATLKSRVWLGDKLFGSNPPKVGDECYFYDEGKRKPTREKIITILKVVPFDEADENVRKSWERTVKYDIIFSLADETDYFIKGVKRDGSFYWLARGYEEGWQDFDVDGDTDNNPRYCLGSMDATGEWHKEMLKEYCDGSEEKMMEWYGDDWRYNNPTTNDTEKKLFIGTE